LSVLDDYRSVSPPGSVDILRRMAEKLRSKKVLRISAHRSGTGVAEMLERHTRHNDVTGGWRSVLRFRRLDRAKPVELRAHLQKGNEVLSETWSYILPPD